jgi:hypothetical protein
MSRWPPEVSNLETIFLDMHAFPFVKPKKETLSGYVEEWLVARKQLNQTSFNPHRQILLVTIYFSTVGIHIARS